MIMTKTGRYGEANSPRRTSTLIILFLIALVLTCIGLSATLYSARVAHMEQYQGLVEQRLKNDELRQTIAETKVQMVEQLNKAQDLESAKDAVSDELRSTQENCNNEKTRLEGELAAANKNITDLEKTVEGVRASLTQANKALNVLRKKVAQHERQQGSNVPKTAKTADTGDATIHTQQNSNNVVGAVRTSTDGVKQADGNDIDTESVYTAGQDSSTDDYLN